VDTGTIPPLIFTQPSNCALQTFLQPNRWPPAEQATRLAIGRQQALDFTLLRAQALLVANDLDWFANEPGNQPRQVAYADLTAGTQVDSFAKHSGRRRGLEKPID